MSYNLSLSLREFHFILPLESFARTLAEGIAPNITYTPSESLESRVVQFTSLFFNGNNCVLKSLGEEYEKFCVLRVDPRVIQSPNSVIVDREATDEGAKFYQGLEGLEKVNLSFVYSERGWLDRKASLKENRERAKQRCASVLVPGGLPSSCITGMYVVSEKVKSAVLQMSWGMATPPVIVKPGFFFQKEERLPPPIVIKSEKQMELDQAPCLQDSSEESMRRSSGPLVSENKHRDKRIKESHVSNGDVTPLSQRLEIPPKLIFKVEGQRKYPDDPAQLKRPRIEDPSDDSSDASDSSEASSSFDSREYMDSSGSYPDSE